MTNAVEPNQLYDRVYIVFKGLAYVAEYPLCEIIDGRIVDIDEDYVKMKLGENKTANYTRTAFVHAIDRALNEHKIVALAVRREGSTRREQIL